MTTQEYRALGLKLGDVVTIIKTDGNSIDNVFVASNDYYEVPAKYYNQSSDDPFPPRIATKARPPSILYTNLREFNAGASLATELSEIASIIMISKADART